MKQPTPIFYGRTTDKGKLDIVDHEREAMRRWVRTFKPKTPVDITIKKHGTKRSNKQNGYYWGTVIPILADFFGHDNPEDMHDDLKLKFNPIESKIQKGKIIGGTTTKLSTVDFFSAETSYVERICRWASMEYEVYIPPPKKVE